MIKEGSPSATGVGGVANGSAAKIAVLLATYNGGKYLSEFLDSVIAQSEKNIVVYVRDDGSSDETLAIVAAHAARLPIVVLPTERRLGPGHSFLTLLRAAADDCTYFAFADQDDKWLPNKLERARSALESSPDLPSVYFARVEYVDEHLSHLGYSPAVRQLGFPSALVENVAMGCTMMLNRAGRLLVLEGNPAQLTMHDWWVYLLMTGLGRTVADDFIALQYRQHANNAVGGTANVFTEYQRKIVQFIKRDPAVVSIAQQAGELKALYSGRLSLSQRRIVEQLAPPDQGFWKRLGLCVWSPFRRQRPADTMILRLLFLLGRY
jgi:glycosyltransferase involved in cell wall biosynthesis